LDEVREADLLLHVVDISHPSFEDHIQSVNTILQEIQSADKPTIMVFNKIDAYNHLTLDADDLVTEKTKAYYSLDEWKKTYLNKGRDKAIFISALEKDNLEDFKEMVYESVKEIHITRFPYNDFLYQEFDKE
jgi:GTP-binding protein HflX